MKDVNALHRQLCPTKVLSNFWKSADYLAAAHAAEAAGRTAKEPTFGGNKAHPAVTMVDPIVALAFIRWADSAVFYARLNKIVSAL